MIQFNYYKNDWNDIQQGQEKSYLISEAGRVGKE